MEITQFSKFSCSSDVQKTVTWGVNETALHVPEAIPKGEETKSVTLSKQITLYEV